MSRHPLDYISDPKEKAFLIRLRERNIAKAKYCSKCTRRAVDIECEVGSHVIFPVCKKHMISSKDRIIAKDGASDTNT